ncbi:MAG: DUF58 domain-containing protein [Acidimicrobiia bacterium]
MPDRSAPPTTDDFAHASAVLRLLELQVTRKLDGLLHGEHLGLVPGVGSESGEARPYAAGDDVRYIDWNLTARMNDPYIREPIADRELETWVVADRSASLDFGTAEREKRDLVTAAAAAIGFLVARGGNRVGGVVIDELGAAPAVVPPRNGRVAMLALLERLDRAGRHDTPARGADLATAIETCGRVAKRRGFVWVVSDFLTPAGWDRSLRVLAARHEVLAVEVIDPRELELPDVGLLTVVDPESGHTLEVPTQKKSVREQYAAAAAEQREEIAHTLRAAGVGHLQLRTDRDWLLDIVRFVADRRRARFAGVANS